MDVPKTIQATKWSRFTENTEELTEVKPQKIDTSNQTGETFVC